MELAKKLQLPPETGVFVLNAPGNLKMDLKVLKKHAAGGPVLLFANNVAILERLSDLVVVSARADSISWIAYPKAGKLGTDLNRDELFRLMKPHGIEGVRLVSIDDTWSAMRFRPARSK